MIEASKTDDHRLVTLKLTVFEVRKVLQGLAELRLRDSMQIFNSIDRQAARQLNEAQPCPEQTEEETGKGAPPTQAP